MELRYGTIVGEGSPLPDLQGSKITKILRNSGRGNPSPTEEKVPPTNLNLKAFFNRIYQPYV
jgi:hypothetical protein